MNEKLVKNWHRINLETTFYTHLLGFYEMQLHWLFSLECSCHNRVITLLRMQLLPMSWTAFRHHLLHTCQLITKINIPRAVLVKKTLVFSKSVDDWMRASMLYQLQMLFTQSAVKFSSLYFDTLLWLSLWKGHLLVIPAAGSYNSRRVSRGNTVSNKLLNTDEKLKQALLPIWQLQNLCKRWCNPEIISKE